MSAIRRDAEATHAGALGAGRRFDELLQALDAALRRIDALTLVNEVLVRSLGSMLEPEDLATLRVALDALAEPDEALDRARDAADRSRRLGQNALDQWLEERARAKRREPWIPVRGETKRQPKGVVQVDSDGKVWSQDDGGDPADPLAGRY